MSAKIPVYFHDEQLAFKPLYEWAFGEKIDHPETTARAESILRAIGGAPEIFERRVPGEVPLEAIRALHSYNLLTLYNAAAVQLGPGETFYPMVFPKHRDGAGDPTNLHQSGAFCFDSGTPLAHNTWEAASWSAACAWSAAGALDAAADVGLTYALSRPPGHHANGEAFGGYCYFNNVAVAIQRLPGRRVAVVDIDYHHGNGTQTLFYDSDQVLTISVHGDPRESFPYFAGYASETGKDAGLGYNLNIPLPLELDGERYLKVIDEEVLPMVERFGPDVLIIAAGFDTYVDDPVGHFRLVRDDYHPLGERFGRLGLPTLVVQEGGYNTEALGDLVTRFLRGVQAGQAATRP